MTTNNAVNTSLSSQTGTGSFVGSTSPTLVTPVLGAANATSINFGGSTLSTYTAETSWTPVFTFATPGNISNAYTIQVGFYTRIGNIVMASFSLSFTPTFSTSSGNAAVSGLPFSSNSATNSNSIGSVLPSFSTAWPTSTTSAVLFLPPNSSAINLYGIASALNGGFFTTANFTSGQSTIIHGSIVYSV